MDDRDAELAEIYDAIFAGHDDAGFWTGVAAEAGGPVLELGCGTGRVLLPLVRAGSEVTGLDLAPHMLERCRHKLALEPPEVRARAVLVEGDMTAFALDRRFALVLIPFAGFQQLPTVEDQLACLARCREHLLPRGRLILDLPNPDPAPPSHAREGGAEDTEAAAELDLPGGRRLRWRAEVTAYHRARQLADYELTYDVEDAAGARRLTETLSLRYVFRYELEHLLVRAGFGVAAVLGDHDGSPFGDESPALIVVAEPRPE